MRIMIAVVALMAASVPSIAMMSPSRAGQAGNGDKDRGERQRTHHSMTRGPDYPGRYRQLR